MGSMCWSYDHHFCVKTWLESSFLLALCLIGTYSCFHFILKCENVYGGVLQRSHFWLSSYHDNMPILLIKKHLLHTVLLLEYLSYSCAFALCDYSYYPKTKNLQMVSFWVTWIQSRLCDDRTERTFTKHCLVMFPDMRGILQCMDCGYFRGDHIH